MNLRNKKLITTLVLLVLIISGIAVIFELRSQTESRKEENEQVTQDQEDRTALRPDPIIVNTNTIRKTTTNYFTSVLKTANNVIDYSFGQNALLYATPDGIFETETKKPIFQNKISYISFTDTGGAIIQSTNQFFLLNTDLRTKSISIEGKNPKLSKDQTTVTSFNESTLYIYYSQDNTRKNIDTGTTIDGIEWANSKNEIAVYGESTNTYSVKLYSRLGELIDTFDFDKGSKMLDISPDAKYIAVWNNDTVTLKPTDLRKNDINFIFKNDDTIRVDFINEIELVISQTQTDSLDRISNRIWKATTTGDISYITDTYVITNKLNLDAPIRTNKPQNVLVLPEKDGPLWMISLVAGQYPFYSNGDIFLQTLPQQIYLPGD